MNEPITVRWGQPGEIRGIHVTDRHAGDLICASGFRASCAGYGTGVYLATDDLHEAVEFYTHLNGGVDQVALGCTITVRRPLIVDVRVGAVEHLDHETVCELIADTVASTCGTVGSDAVSAAGAAGADALIVNCDRFDSATGGSQLVAVDASAVQVVGQWPLADGERFDCEPLINWCLLR